MVDVRLESFGLNAKLIEPKPMGRIHHHNEIELNYLFRGGVTYLHRWVHRKLPVRRVTVFWGAIPHSLTEVEKGSLMAWITLPLPWVRQWQLPEPFIHGLMEGQWWTEERTETEGERYSVLSWVKELTDDATGPHEALMLELEACLIRLAAQKNFRQLARNALVRGKAPAIWNKVEAMARFMAEHFPDEIGVTDVAHAADLHPKYAMSLFRRATGATIKEFLLQNRITHAQRLLLTTSNKVIDVALASGFRSLSAFYTCFVRQMHETPNDFRRRIRGIAEE